MLSLRRGGPSAAGASLLLIIIVAIGGCSGTAKTNDYGTKLTRLPTLADAPMIYAKAGCDRCHGAITGGGRTAPDLAHAGSKHGPDLVSNVTWIGDQIRNPKSHNPNTTMPTYDESKMAYGNAQVLATVLAKQR